MSPSQLAPRMMSNALIWDTTRPAPTMDVMMMEASQEQIDQIVSVLGELSDDTSVPRNIRRGSNEATALLRDSKDALDVRIFSAISILDNLANDPNIPLHGRTLIWNILNMLESLKPDAS